jgi:hypothetical protein
MNQSEETIATAPAEHLQPHTNGEDNNGKCKTPYQNLQGLIGHEIGQIHTILTKFYEEYGEEYYLVPGNKEKTNQHKDLFKWTIARSGDSSRVEVFFRGKSHALDIKESQMAADATPAPQLAAQAKAAQTNQTQSADIYTYDEVGAPPSGPTPAKPVN